MVDISTITPEEVAQRQVNGDIKLIDVRTPVEFREVHASAAKNIPLDKLDPSEFKASGDAEQNSELYVICRSGSRGKQACQKLVDAGIENVINVEGGTQAWEAAGLPVVRGKKAISLERQVRIVAGSIVLIGAILALTVHPYFAGVSGFIGAGLLFAGITDTCGMGMMLAKMPWNQVCDNGESCST